MRKTLLGSLTSLLIPFAAYGANISYGAYQRRQSTYIGAHQPLPLADGQRHSFAERTFDASAAELDISAGAAATELVIIDAAVPDKHILYRAAKPGVDIVEITSTESGLAQLTGVLSRYRNLSALHIVSHALHGELLLGNSRITAENIKHEIEAFAALNGALRDGGDLLLYGCDLAAGDAGTELLEIIHGNTHLDVAASSDKTGARDLTGDWDLEISTGNIETELPFSDKALKDFSAILAAGNGTYNFSGFTDAGATLTSNDFIVSAKDSSGAPSVPVSIYGSAAFISGGAVSVSNYFYVTADGVNTGSFELTGLAAAEYYTGEINFTNVRIVGILRDNSQITSTELDGNLATGDEDFIFGAGQLSNFAGVQLKAFKLYFDVTTRTAAGGGGGPFVGDASLFDFNSFTIANAQNPAASDGNLTAAGSVTEPVGLDTTIDTDGEAVNVFDFTIADGGTGDSYNLTVSELFINVSGTSTDAERSQVTWRLHGPDHPTPVEGTYNAGTDRITFSGLNINVANGGNETYFVNAYYNDTLGLTEDHTFILSVDGDSNLTVGALGTQMGSTTAVTNGTGSTIDVVATQLSFTTDPAGSVSGSALTTQPVVTAHDAALNTDVDFSATITLTEASAGTLSGDIDVAAVNGVATFTDVVYTATADQQSFTLTASAAGVTDGTADAVTSDVVATKLLFTTQPSPTNVANATPTSFTTVPVISAVDANDLVDTGYSTAFVLAEANGAGSATMTVDGDEDISAVTVTLTPSSGVATFTNLAITYTVSGASNETFNLRTASGGLTIADSNQLTAITNNAPTDIGLSANNINQSSTGAAVAVGTLSTTDADGGDSHTYSLVNNGASGNGSCGAAGDDDNASFQIDNVNDELETVGSLSPGSYSVCMQTSDGAASYQETFSITVVDDVVPTVSSVSVPANATYITGQNLNFTVNTDENVTVNTTGGTPRIELTIGATTRQAAYLSGSGTSALVFRYTVQAGDSDADGIVVAASIDANGGTLRDGGNNDLNTTLNSVGSTASVLVDGIAPTVSSVNVPANATYVAGQDLEFTVNTDDNVTVNTTGGTPQIALTIGATTRQAAYVSGSGTSSLVFRYTVQTGDSDTDGIAVAASIDANGGTLQDSSGNDLNTTLNSVGSTASVLVDAIVPTVTSVSVPSNATYIAGQDLDFTVNTNENVTVNTTGGTPQIALTIGAATQQAVYLSGSGTSSLVFRYTVQAGDNDTDGIAVAASIDANGGTLQDGAGNDMNTTLNSVGSTASVLVDAVAPTVSSVSVPANATYASGQNLDFTVNTNENVTVNTTGGTPQIALTIGATTRQAAYLSGTGTSALVFRHTVQAGDLDTDGIAVAANIDANSGTLRDAAGNDMTLTLNSVGSTAAVLVDASAPINNLPAAQITDSITQLVFSSGNGNAIAVTDDGSLTVVISIGSGTLTASTGGSAVITNNSTGTVTVTGSAAEVNVALEGLTYTPNGAGDYTLNIQSTDSAGNVDDDDLDITVDPGTLLVTSDLDTGDDETAAGSLVADQADGDGLSIREALNWARAQDTITFDLDSGTAGNQGGTITLNGSTLTVAYSNINIDGDLDDDGSADVTISGNNASRVMLINGSLTGIELTGLTLTQGNTTGGGGGLALGTSASVTVRDSNITNNIDSGTGGISGGGGIYGSSVTLTVINSTVSENSAEAFGGGIRTVGSSVLNVINSTISGNTTTGATQHGGGIQFAGPTLTIINSTISGNAASGASSDGGGLRISSGTSYIYNTTIVGNAAANSGGGVSANGTTDNFINTVVAGNTAGAGATPGAGGSPLATGGADSDAIGTIEVATNSFFGTTATITTDNSSLNTQGTGNLLLGNLGNYNGSAIQTHRPQTGSALLEAGSNVALPPDTYDLDSDSNTAEALPVDANGDTRVSNIVDIGAVEGNAAPALSNVNGGGTFVENGSAIVIDNDTLVSDNDLDLLNGGNGDYSGASAVFARNGGAVASDSFGFNDGSGISLSGSDLVKNGQVIGSLDTSTAGQLTITFTNANGEIPTQTDVSAILQQVTYSSSSEDPGSSADIDITLHDDAGASATETASLTITEINDAPTLTATGGTPTFTESGSAVDLFSGITVSTVEAGQTVTGLSLTVSSLADGASEILTIDGTDVALTNGTNGTTAGNSVGYNVSVAGSTATVTLGSAGLSTAVTQTLVDGMTYSHAGTMPSGTSRVVTLAGITDSGGTANGGVDASAVSIGATVTIASVNNAPAISAPATIAITEDVAGAITGISFSDVDAGSGLVSVGLSVGSGSLTAASGAGVTVGGTTSAMTLTGTITDINSFIAASAVSFTTATDSATDVTLNVAIDDNGNTGGGAQTDSTTVTLDVSAVNDAPVNTVPGAQDVDQDSTLVFSSGNGNLISISDVDAGSNSVEISLTATNGLISLSGITGLSFTTGDGTSDSTLVFTGSIADINSSLSGLVFAPTGGYNGAASIAITTNDQGWSGSGGAQGDTDTINITVNPLNPEITSTGTSASDGIYGLGDTLSLTVTFDQTVIVDTAGGTPTLLLETGTTDRSASYTGGSGTSTLTFSYTVQADDISADLDYQSTGALALNGGTIESGGGDAAVLTLPATGGVDSIAGQHNLVIDGVVPTLDSSTPTDNATGVARDANIVLTFNEDVVAGAGTVGLYAANGDTLIESFNAAALGFAANVVTINPTSDLTPSSAYYLLIDDTAFVDTASNAYAGIAASTGLNFTVFNAAPVANNDSTTTDEDEAAAVSVLDNDTDADSSLNAASVIVTGAAANGGTSVNTATGVITYTPNADFNGSDSFTYTVQDVYGAVSNAGTVTITINAVNDAPVAVSDLDSTPEDTPVSIDVAANDTDVDTGDSVDNTTITIVTAPTNGNATVNGGVVDYDPNADFNGTDTFTYTIEDQNGAVSNTATVTINVTGVNDLPTAANDSATVDEDDFVDIDVLDNDSDLDGTLDSTTVTVLANPANGSTSVDALTGVITYTPGADFNGADSFTYTVRDNDDGTSNAATVTVTVTSVNDAPVARTDTAIMLEETAHEVNVLGNDSDVDGTLVPATVEIVSAPASGGTSINPATGAITYTPNQDFAGSDTFSYRVRDNDGLWSTAATVTMTVNNVNDAPVAANDTAETDEDTTGVFAVLANDTDMDDAIDPTSVAIVTQPTNGSVTVNPDGTVSYTPSAGYVGSDSFSYTVRDAYGDESNVATVSIDVLLVNTAPVISGTAATSVTVGELYSFTPSLTDPDLDNTWVFSAENLPAWLSFNPATGALSGTPADAHVGSHADILISVDDGFATDALAAFTIIVAEGTDTDGDTISDYQEDLDGTDPLDPTDYLDLTPPDLMAPADITLDAIALFTPVHIKQLLGLPLSASNAEVVEARGLLVTDNVDGAGCCDPSVEDALLGALLLLPPGRNEITWLAEDRMGNMAEVTQIVNLRPLVSLAKDQTTVEGNTVTVAVILNGESPFYPLTVPFVIDDSSTADDEDHNLVNGSVTFTEAGQTRAQISVDIVADNVEEGDETLAIRLDDHTTNAEDLANGYDPQNPDIHDINSGARTLHIIRIVEGNVAPEATLRLQQGGNNTLLVTLDGGPVTATVTVTDPNPDDSHTFDWSDSDSDLIDTDGNAADTTLVFDPSDLDPGLHKVEVQVTDSEGATDTTRMFFLVVSALPQLDAANDTDGDGIDDQSEGTGDADGDGLPDYLDNIDAGNVVPEDADETSSYLVECDPGVSCRLGRFALQGASGGIRLSLDELETLDGLTPDPDYQPVGGIFDFEATGLPVSGQSVRIVIPQRAPIPEEAVYRKFRNGAWATFAEDGNNMLHSAEGDTGYCPPPGDEAWEPGLVAGHLCVQLTIEDGGPNDADAMVNGTVEDPGAVSIPRPVSVNIRSSSGGGAFDHWMLGLLAALCLLSGLSRRGRARRLDSAKAASFAGALFLSCALLLPAGPAQAQDWLRDKLTVEVGVYDTDSSTNRTEFIEGMAAEGVNVDLQRYDISRTAWQLTADYRITDWANVQVGYLDLGKVAVDFTAVAVNNAAIEQALEKRYPFSAEGWTLGYRYRHTWEDKVDLVADAGLYFWDQDIEVNTDSLRPGSDSGTDPLFGLGLGFRVHTHVTAGIRFQRLLVDDGNMNLLGLTLNWGF